MNFQAAEVEGCRKERPLGRHKVAAGQVATLIAAALHDRPRASR